MPFMAGAEKLLASVRQVPGDCRAAWAEQDIGVRALLVPPKKTDSANLRIKGKKRGGQDTRFR